MQAWGWQSSLYLFHTMQLMSTAAFLPLICEWLSKRAREDEGQLVSPVAVLLFNYYCFQIPFSIHSSIYVLIGPFNNQKTQTTKVRACILLAGPLRSCDELSVVNVLLPCGAWPLSTGTFLLGLVASNMKTGLEREKADGKLATEYCAAAGAGGC